MQAKEFVNGHTIYDTSMLTNPTDALDFLNTSDNEIEDIKDFHESLKEFEKKISPETNVYPEDDSGNDDASSLTLSITNVVAMASMRCHLRLKEIARTSINVEYKPLQNHVIMRLRSPYTVATIWSSGKIWCTGANSMAKAKAGARRIARRISKCGFPCQFSKYRVVNIMAICKLPFRVRLDELVSEKPMLMSYEPELSPGLTFKLDRNSSTSLKVFSTGRIVIMGSSLETIGALVEELVPLAALHQTDEPVSDTEDAPVQEDNVGTRNIAKVVQYMKMMPHDPCMETLNVIPDDDSEEEDDYDDDDDDDDSDDNDGYNRKKRSCSTDDDSTDSGASIDSGGMSTKPKRRPKHKLRTNRTNTNSLSVFKSGKVDPDGFAFSKRAVDNLDVSRTVTSSVNEPRRMNAPDINQPSKSETDPAWCRKAVASGSTKRACVITYSGTEDSGHDNSGGKMSNLAIQRHFLTHQNIPVIQQQPSQITQMNLPSQVSIPALAPSLNYTTTISNNNNSSMQYMIIRPTAQSVVNDNSAIFSNNFQQQQQQQQIQLTTSTTAPMTHCNAFVQLNNSSLVNSHSLPVGLSPAVYPMRITTPNHVMPTFVSSTGAKVVAFSTSGTTNFSGNQLGNFNTNSQIMPQVYQVGGQPSIANTHGQFIVGSTMFNTNPPISNSIRQQIGVPIDVSTIFPNPSNCVFGTIPFSNASVQSIGPVNSFTYTPAFVNQNPSSFS